MQSNDQFHSGQHTEDLDLPPVPEPEQPRFTALRQWWNDAWDEGGFLYGRWEEVRQAPRAGWHGMAHWIKAAIALVALCSVIVLLDTAGDIVTAVLRGLSNAAPALLVADVRGIWGAVDHPIHAYLSQSAAHLAVSSSALYACWQLAGLAGLIGGFARSTGARIIWALWGLSSISMVWAASPVGGRTVATGIAALAWTLASTSALRGLSLRRSAPVFQPQFRPELHLHAPIPAPAAPADDFPDTIHQLQQR
jgi:hypothetical protein